MFYTRGFKNHSVRNEVIDASFFTLLFINVMFPVSWNSLVMCVYRGVKPLILTNFVIIYEQVLSIYGDLPIKGVENCQSTCFTINQLNIIF